MKMVSRKRWSFIIEIGFKKMIVLLLEESLSPSLEVRGEVVDDFIADSQDRQKNAVSRALAAAYNVWRESLQSDQIKFESEKIAILG